MPGGRRERAARSAMRRMVRTLGEPHRSTLAAGRLPMRVRAGVAGSVGVSDGANPIDHWAILTDGNATTESGWGEDFEAMGSEGCLIAEY